MNNSSAPFTDGSDESRGVLQANRRSWRGRGRSWWASRGNRGGRGSSLTGPSGSSHGFQSHSDPQEWSLGLLLQTLELNQLVLLDEAVTIRAVRYAASYNWFDCEGPVVAIPGSPPFWTTAPKIEEPLEEDSGDFYRDINAAHFHTYPIEPAVRALLIMKSDINLSTMDIMACSSVLENLLRFSRSSPSVFRCDAQIIGKTLFLVRKENSPKELIQGVRGYGHTFPAAHLKWDYGLEKSVSHQRIITYEFGGLKCLVRFGCDGYVKNPTFVASPATPLGFINPPAGEQTLHIEQRGQEVDQTLIFDIKTRHVSHPIDMEVLLPKLWLTQAPGLLIAYYSMPGIFKSPKINDVKSKVDKWQADNATALRRFRAVLCRIREVAAEAEGGCVEVSWQGSGSLKITKVVSTNGEVKIALPTDLAERWLQE